MGFLFVIFGLDYGTNLLGALLVFRNPNICWLFLWEHDVGGQKTTIFNPEVVNCKISCVGNMEEGRDELSFIIEAEIRRLRNSIDPWFHVAEVMSDLVRVDVDELVIDDDVLVID